MKVSICISCHAVVQVEIPFKEEDLVEIDIDDIASYLPWEEINNCGEWEIDFIEPLKGGE